MSAWTRRREERRRRKDQRAQDRLHGRNARPARSGRRDRDWDDLGELLVDIVLALPRFVAWLFRSILD